MLRTIALVLGILLLVFGVIGLINGSLVYGLVLTLVGLILGGYGREGLR